MLKKDNQKRSRTYLVISFIFLFIIAFIGFPSSVSAQGTPAEPAPALPQDVANIIWLCLTGFLVFFMQAGFAMVEAGMVRSKNSANIMMKNLLDFCFGAILFWAVGYAIMYSSGDSNYFGFDNALSFLGQQMHLQILQDIA